MERFQVKTLRKLEAVERLRVELDLLNLASRRPSPFATFEYLKTFLAHDEHQKGGEKLLFLAAFDGARLVGYLPLRKRLLFQQGVPYHQIDLLVWHDTDRPYAVARAEDETLVSEAFYRHLLRHERFWSFLELQMQDEASALSRPPPLNRLRYYLRRYENMPNTTVPLPATFAAYFGGLHASQRHNLARLGRRLMGAGNVEVVGTSEPAARRPLLELYLDLERRSWKEAAHAGIRRHPKRLDFFRALCEPEQPMGLGVDLVLLDGLPIAGLVSGAFAGGLYGLEMAFDADHEDLAPGHLLALMSARRGIEGGFRSLNFNGNYSYYKAKLGGVVTPTQAVQVFRVGGAPWLKARLGDLRRWLKPPEEQAQGFNPDRRKVEGNGTAEPGEAKPKEPRVRPERREERELARLTLEALERERVPMARLSGDELVHALPFPVRKEAA